MPASRRSRGHRLRLEPSWSPSCSRTRPTIIATCSRVDDPELVEHVELLAVVAAQDVEIVDDGDGPTARIRQGVAAERIISTVDTDARHGHRSRRDRYDGYKVHVSADIDSDLICSITATTATTHDAAVLDTLLDDDPVPVAEVIADTHYGSVETRQTLGRQGIDLVAPAPPASSPKGLFSKADFAIDLDAATVTCPAGHTVTIPSHGLMANGSRSVSRRRSAPRVRCMTNARNESRVA